MNNTSQTRFALLSCIEGGSCTKRSELGVQEHEPYIVVAEISRAATRHDPGKILTRLTIADYVFMLRAEGVLLVETDVYPPRDVSSIRR